MYTLTLSCTSCRPFQPYHKAVHTSPKSGWKKTKQTQICVKRNTEALGLSRKSVLNLIFPKHLYYLLSHPLHVSTPLLISMTFALFFIFLNSMTPEVPIPLFSQDISTFHVFSKSFHLTLPSINTFCPLCNSKKHIFIFSPIATLHNSCVSGSSKLRWCKKLFASTIHS